MTAFSSPSSVRSLEAEWMDDFSMTGDVLTGALDNLRAVNRWLGGYRATLQVLTPWLMQQRSTPVRLLDVATGLADTPEVLINWASTHGIPLQVDALDANPAVLEYADQALNERLLAPLRRRIQLVEGDALALPYPDNSIDIVHAALFMHHLDDEQAVMLLREMQRVARVGIVVNDLHRHALAYYGVRLWSSVLPVSDMFAHDAPLSVCRGFQEHELQELSRAAELEGYVLRWHWAFRWTLSTIPAQS